jgi:hypothetical protein
MRNTARRAGTILFLAAATGVLVPACAPDESSLFIRGCLNMPSDTCTVNADTATVELGSGALDAAQRHDYHCPLLIGNQLVPRGDQNKLRTETSRIEITSAVVTVTVTADDGKVSTVETFEVPASGFADPGTSSAPGYGIADVTLLDAATASDPQYVGQTLEAHVKVKGRTLGGNVLESGEWIFPIVVTPREAYCDIAPCLPNAMATDMAKINCHPGFDSTTDCRQGCGCTVGVGDCGLIGCIGAKGAKVGDPGVCGACSSNADCSPRKCVKSAGAPQGLCQ